MRLLFAVTFIIFVITGCEKQFSPYNYSEESTIFSQTEETAFREMVLTLRPYVRHEGMKEYIVTDSLFNVKIEINNKEWGTFNSFQIDTALFESQVIQNYRITDSVKYPVIAPFQTPKDSITTAGGYSDLLNGYVTLSPGVYICKIKSFDLRDLDGNVHTIKTTIMEPFEVKENTRSAFIGQFDVLIN